MSNRETALAFVAAINAHEPQRIAALMAPDHVFVDTHGQEESREQMLTGWPGYFAWFPDYRIEVEEVLESGAAVVLLGHASGTYQNRPGRHWRLPAAWRAEVQNGLLRLWQVYCDSKIPYEAMGQG